MKNTNTISSYGKINIHIGVIKKQNPNFHKIETLVTYVDLCDKIYIKEINNKKNKIIFYGNYAKLIGTKNTISKLLHLLERENITKNKRYLIKIKKNIPPKSGMGGGSMNAASILRFIIKKNKIKLKKKKIISLCKIIGSDVQLGLDNQTKIMFKNGEIKNVNKFKSYLLIVLPNFGCSTKHIYKNLTKYSKTCLKSNKKYNLNNSKNLYNDLESSAFELYPKLANLKKNLQILPNIDFARMTGSGSVIIGYFRKKIDALHGAKLIKKKYKNYWCIVSKTI